MSCGEPCDGCIDRATHHLCDSCVMADIDRVAKERDMYRDEATRQMEYGIKQHEFAQDALQLRDAARDAAEGLQETLRDREVLLDERGRRLEDALAEVARLREAARQVHALADEAVKGTAVGAWLQVQEIHKITKGMVE